MGADEVPPRTAGQRLRLEPSRPRQREKKKCGPGIPFWEEAENQICVENAKPDLALN